MTSLNLEPWQQDIVDQLYNDCKNGKRTVVMTGRHTGKSYWTNQAIKRLMDDLQAMPVSDIVLNEGTVYGARYYTAEPIGGNWLEMEQWCNKVFGDGCRALWGEAKAPEPARRWYANNRKFWFREEKDRDWFIVRWRA